MVDLQARRPDGDPVLPLERVCLLNEILIVRYENERRRAKQLKKKNKRRR